MATINGTALKFDEPSGSLFAGNPNKKYPLLLGGVAQSLAPETYVQGAA